MCMTRNYCKTLLLSTILTATTFAAGAQELPWPRTFSGQPDFEFLRNEVATEFRKKKGSEADKYIATLDGLNVERQVDPFTPTPVTADIGRSKYSRQSFESRLGSDNKAFRDVYPDIEVGTGVNVILANGNTTQAQLIDDNHVRLLESDRKIKIEVSSNGDIVEAIKREDISKEFDLLFAKEKPENGEGTGEGENADNLKGLPTFNLTDIKLPEIENISTEDKLGLKDFASYLENILVQSLRDSDVDLKNRDFSQEVNNISIQSIVTSPMQYVIINHRRYSVGDRFIMRVEIDENEGEKDLSALIDGYIPSKDEVDEAVHAQYLKIKEEALKQFKEKNTPKDAEGKVKDKTQNVSVIVKDIKRRGITVSIHEQDYPLKMRLSL